MDNKSDSLNLFMAKCRENNLKITPQRTAIYKEFSGACDHPSADLIFKRLRKKFPHISLDTVNRTLLAFADIGVAKVVEGYGKPKRFDPDIKNHHHFQCIKCYRIIDFHDKTYDNINVPSDIRSRLTVLNKKVVLEGICDKCK